MWIVTSIGFFSLTNHRDQPDNMMVRGRVRSDMERLIKLIPAASRKSGIIETHDSDYRYRVIADRKAMGEVFGKLVAGMDYIGFKDTVAERQGKRREAIYYSIWEELHDLQTGEERLEKEELAIARGS